MLCATAVAAHDFEVGGIYYNILSETDKTVEVTKKNNTTSSPYTGDVVIPSTVVASGTISTVLKTFDAWISTNKNNSTTSQTSYTLNVEAGNILKFDWSVSSESSYDWLIITLDGTEIVKKSGTLSGSYEKTFDAAGSHTLVVKYTKDGSQSSGNDEGKIFNVTLNALNGDVVVDVEYRVISIGYSAFSGCSGLRSIEIPNSVTSIGAYAFYNCTGLTSIEIPNSVTSIGGAAFSNCTGLTGIEIPDSITRINDTLFKGCSKLRYIIIGRGVTSIGYFAFTDCYKLGVVINMSNMTIYPGSDSSGNMSSGVDVNDVDKVELVGDFYFSGKSMVLYKGNATNLSLPADYNGENYVIGNDAFINCTGLTSVEIPNSVTIIGREAFSGCTGLTGIEIPASVTSIGEGAFGGCTGLTSIEIPASVTRIGYYAFRGCTGLTSIEIPASVTWIGDYAFRGCTGLTSVEIPNSVTIIGREAFSGCTGLANITSLIPADKLFVPQTDAFYDINKTTCTLYVPYGAKETYAATEGWNEFTNIVELEKPITEVNIIINQYGNATFCSEYALDFSEVEGLKAYAATGYKTNSQVVTLTRVQTSEAGIGLFLKGEPGEYVVPLIESTDEHSLNMLVGTLEPTIVNSTAGEMSNYKFTIADGDAAPMFYPFEDNTTFSAGKAYLQIPTAWLSATAQKSLSVRFDDGETTDIDELKGESGEVKTIYDLSGRVVENPTSGIYIINGKKVVVK